MAPPPASHALPHLSLLTRCRTCRLPALPPCRVCVQYPANVRVTRLAAARQRLLQEKQLPPEKQRQQQPCQPTSDAMEVDDNLDQADESNPQSACQYVKEIYVYLRDREVSYRVSPHFMQVRHTSCHALARAHARTLEPRAHLAVHPPLPQTQRDINATMRGILIDWLVEVAEEYRLEAETLHLSVNYIDRFLSCVPVARSKLQLVGVTCMLIASKYEEIHPPAVDEFVYISDNTYKREEILHMEGTILNRLSFELSVVSAKAFLTRYIKAARMGECDATTVMLCQYLCELTLQEYSFLKYLPSEVAAAALRLALHTMRLPAWTPLLETITGFTAEKLQSCVSEMLTVFRKAETNSLQAVREKYSHAKFLCVSMLAPPAVAP